ncbi:hypothetical protein EYF80_066810 [Liparis tanakae]|uniref:Uncharacterized protein n=1 Tax=Liparis tanakae TaxID=230148 RepID=A0A4Z2E2W9_9TELE|nr:hypothetical protein EYF80_066810 [Liparis tanakae]
MFLQSGGAERTQVDPCSPARGRIRKEAGPEAHLADRLQQDQLEAARIAEDAARKAAQEAARQLEAEHSARIVMETLPQSNEQTRDHEPPRPRAPEIPSPRDPEPPSPEPPRPRAKLVFKPDTEQQPDSRFVSTDCPTSWRRKTRTMPSKEHSAPYC